MAGAAGLLKFLRPRLRPQSDDVKAAAAWGFAAAATGLYVVQPFNWLKKTFFEKPEPNN